MAKNMIRKIALIILLGFIYVIIAFVIALIIFKSTGSNMQDTMTIEGIVIAVLGAMSMMEGNPSGISLQGMGSKGAQFHSQMLLETVRYEREKTDYYKNFLKHSVVQLSFGGLTIVIGGILTLLCGILLF